jgi:MFS family permease
MTTDRFGSLLLLAGRIGDLVSRRGMFLGGLTVFTLASALCGLATSPEMLIAARFLQGIGGAATSAVILGMIVTLFPRPGEQARAIGVHSFVASAVAARRLLPADRGPGPRRGADIIGAALITGALMLTVYSVVSPLAAYGWTGLLAAVLGIAFVIRPATAATPSVPPRVFRSRTLTGAYLAQLPSAAGMFGMFFVGVLYVQHVLGYDAMGIGPAFLPVTVVMGGLSLRCTDRLIGRFGARLWGWRCWPRWPPTGPVTGPLSWRRRSWSPRAWR